MKHVYPIRHPSWLDAPATGPANAPGEPGAGAALPRGQGESSAVPGGGTTGRQAPVPDEQARADGRAAKPHD